MSFSRRHLILAAIASGLAVWSFFVSAILVTRHNLIAIQWADHEWHAIGLSDGAIVVLTGKRQVVTVSQDGSQLSSSTIGWTDPMPQDTAPESVRQDAADAQAIRQLTFVSLNAWPPFRESQTVRGTTTFVKNYPSGFGGSSAYMPMGRAVTGRAISAWLVAVLPIALIALAFTLKLLRVRRPLNTDRCRRCGYDLRATPDRCPECGTRPVASPGNVADA